MTNNKHFEHYEQFYRDFITKNNITVANQLNIKDFGLIMFERGIMFERFLQHDYEDIETFLVKEDIS